MLELSKAVRDPNRKHYFSIVKEGELARFVADLKKHGEEIILWCQGAEKKAESFTLKSIEGNDKAPILKLTQKGGLLSKLTGSSLIDKEVLAKITLGKYTFFTTSFLSYDPNSSVYTAVLEETIYKSQQRSNYRLAVSEFIKVQFKMNERIFDCNDISAGGTSFTLGEEEKELFQKDQQFVSCELLFNKKKFNIPKAKIAGTFPNKDQNGKELPGIKVGVAFVSIPDQTEEDLTIHINSEARAEEIQKRFRKKKKAKTP